jgi:hypothetical protein
MDYTWAGHALPKLEGKMSRFSRITASLLEPFIGAPPVLLVLFVLSSTFAILFFGQPDLFHTVISSYAYLDGHIVDFYDFNAGVVQGNDYLPAVYVIFALWMSPFAAFGKLAPEAWRPSLHIHGSEILWAKLLLLLTFLICFYLISAIVKYAYSAQPEIQKTIRWAFLFSPLIGFAVFTFGQYDIFSVAFTLAGLLAYFKRNSFWFVFWFSIAISFKYFALALFIPLALFYFKKNWQILLALAGSLVFTLIEVATYWGNVAFRTRTVFGLAGGKVNDPLHNPLQTILGILFVFICVLAYLHGRKSTELTKPLTYIWVAAYAIIFEAVLWHPQWTVILVPAFALSLGLMKRPGWFLIWESMAFLIFILVVEFGFPGNVDVSMIQRGPISQFLHAPNLNLFDFLTPKTEPILFIGVQAFFISPLLWLGIERVSKLAESQLKNPSNAHWFLRVLTLPLVLTLPALVLTIVPRDAVVKGPDTPVAFPLPLSANAPWSPAEKRVLFDSHVGTMPESATRVLKDS